MSARAIAAWPGPALLAGVIAAVAAGAAAAPILLTGVAIAPLLALMQPPRSAPLRHPVALAIAAVVAALLLWAQLAALADAAVLLGARRWQATALAGVAALLVTLAPVGVAWRRELALAVGIGGLAFALVSAGAATDRVPWVAWSDAAARPALVFTGQSPWVADGERVLRSTTLAFDDGQRVIALSPGTFRIVEADGVRPVVREWRLAAGDALTLRPGDTLTAEAGSRLRFEPGKRVPGAPASGPAWADATTRTFAPGALALLATITLGACALIPGADRRVIPASGLALAWTLGIASWGAYATLGAPEAGLAGSPLEAVLALPRAVPPTAHSVAPGMLVAVIAVALLALFVAAADRLREMISEAGGARWPHVWPAAMMAATLAATAGSVTPWVPLLSGLGLAGSAVAVPRLAGGADARIGPWPAGVIGGLVGATVFLALAAFGSQMPPALAMVAHAPVVAAAPAAWLTMKFLRRDAISTR